MKEIMEFHKCMSLVLAVTTTLLFISLQTLSQTGSPAWTALGPYGGTIGALTIDPRNSNTLYAGADGVALFKSTDGGASWRKTGLVSTTNYSKIAINPQNSRIVYAATAAGFYVSSNRGATWNATSAGLPNDSTVRALVFDLTNTNIIYAGTEGSGVYKSTDGGLNWQSANSGLINLKVYSLLIISGAPNTLLAGTGQGVFKSTDGGNTWTSVNTGLPSDTEVYVLARDATAGRVYAGGSNGVFGILLEN
ncbi:MAG: hypothetical protein HY314_10455 [Acidobacteria bacterium]|nr:hypothetical protein [Acidobacteriota bacterium]